MTTTKTPQREDSEQRKSVIQWLLDSDPSIRWQVMLDLMDDPKEIVAGERSRVASEGWGARLLDLQGPDGQWGGGTWVSRSWISTSDTLLLLRDLGLDPTSERARRAIGLVRENSTWGPEFDDAPYFEGEVEPCINGRDWTQFSFPTRWHYDVLRGLDYLRESRRRTRPTRRAGHRSGGEEAGQRRAMAAREPPRR